MTSPAPKPLILTLMLGAWNWDEIERDGRETWTPDYSYLVERAEAAKLHALFLGDNPEIDLRVHIGPGIKSPLEPITLMAYLAARTEHIGLVASVSTTFQSPYNVARFFASLDLDLRAALQAATARDGRTELLAAPVFGPELRLGILFPMTSWAALSVAAGGAARVYEGPEGVAFRPEAVVEVGVRAEL